MAKKNGVEKSIEANLWEAANKLRGSVEPAEYKHIVLSLIFLKFVSDKFDKQREKLIAEGKEKYVERPEFCYSATFEEIAKKDYSLISSKY